MPKIFAFESFRSSRWFKPAMAVAGAILLLLVALLVLPALIDINTYRGQIISQLEKRLGRSVKLGQMKLSVAPSIKIKVDDVVIGDDPQFAQADFVKASSVKLQIGLWSLLKGNPEILGVDLVEPAVTLIKSGEGKWNWGTLKPLQSSTDSSDQDSALAPFDLLVSGGRFTLIDRAVKPAVERTFTDINVALDDFSPRQAFDFTISLTIPGEKAGKVEVEGKAGPVDSKDAALTPIDARAHMRDVDLAGLESLLGLTQGHAGRLTLDLNVKGKPAENMSGSGKLTNSRLQMSPAAKPIEVSNADLGFTSDSLRIDNLAAKLGSNQINGWMQVKNFDHPLAKFDLKANELSVPELQQAMASDRKSPKARADSSEDSPLRAEGRLAVGKLILEGLTATDMQSGIALDNQALKLDPLSLKLYGGSYQGSARIDLSGGNSPEIALNGRFDGLDVNQLLSSSGQKSAIYGRAGGSLDVRGRAGGSSDALLQTLVGNGSLAISDGKFASFDLMKQIGALGKLLNLPIGGAGTAFSSFKTNLKFDHGRMTTDPLQLVMDELAVSGQGVMRLGEAPAIDYELLARLSPALTKRALPQSGGAEVGSLLQTIGKVTSTLGNFFVDGDAMVVPIKMSGPLSQPAFGLDSVVLQKRAKGRLLEDFSERLNKGTGKEDGKEAGKPKPADLLKGVLDSFKRKEKQ